MISNAIISLNINYNQPLVTSTAKLSSNTLHKLSISSLKKHRSFEFIRESTPLLHRGDRMMI